MKRGKIQKARSMNHSKNDHAFFHDSKDSAILSKDKVPVLDSNFFGFGDDFATRWHQGK
jgi:hypothetical protein